MGVGGLPISPPLVTLMTIENEQHSMSEKTINVNHDNGNCKTNMWHTKMHSCTSMLVRLVRGKQICTTMPSRLTVAFEVACPISAINRKST